MMMMVKASLSTKMLAWCCLFGPQCYAMVSSTDQWAGALDAGGENRDRTTGWVSGGLMASPDCWLDSLRALNLDITTTADACSWMTATYQKLMALELARCHVYDLGRTLFDESNELYNSAKCTNTLYREHLGECLIYLTPSAETAYTHFLTYINQLCTRLSREVVMNQFYDISVNLAKVAIDAKNQLQETLQQQENAWLTWKQQEGFIVDFFERLQEQFHQEQDRWTRESLRVLSQWQEDQDEWLQRQKDSQQDHLSVMEEQQEELRRQKEELTRLSDALAHTHQSIRPWSLTLEDLYQYAKIASCFLRMALHLGGCVVTCWFLTYPRCLSWLRRWLLSLIVAGAVVEALVFWNLQSESKFFHFDGTWEEISTTIKSTFGICEGVLYILGCLITPFCRGGYRSPSRLSVDANLNPRHVFPPTNERRDYHQYRNVQERRRRNDGILPGPQNNVSPLEDDGVMPHNAAVVATPSPPIPMAFIHPPFPRHRLGVSLDRDMDSQQKKASTSRDHRSDKGNNVLHSTISLDQVGWHYPSKKELCAPVRVLYKSSSSDTSSSSSTSTAASLSSSTAASSSTTTAASRSSDDLSMHRFDSDSTVRSIGHRIPSAMATGSKRTIDSRMSLDTDGEVVEESRKRPKFFEDVPVLWYQGPVVMDVTCDSRDNVNRQNN